MEIIKTLNREVNKRISLTKLKLDKNKDITFNMDKIITFMGKDLNNFDLENISPEEYLKFNNFELTVEKVYNSQIKNRIVRKFKKSDSDLYEISAEGCEGFNLAIYTIPEVKIPISYRKYVYAIPNSYDRKKILDIKYIYGAFKTIDVVLDEIREKEDFYLSKEFQNISIFKNCYDKKDAEELLDIIFTSRGSLLCLKGMDFLSYAKTISLIIDVAAVMQNLDLNNELTEKYNNRTNSECARAFETKKNIPDKILKVMNSNKFLDDFSYVEIDEGTDIQKFHSIEYEWNKIKNALNLEKFFGNVKPELRFKKLGKHRALGLYYPGLKCICVDITSPSSLLHEYGHFIDYTFGKKQLSLQLEFYQLISEYQKAYNDYLIKNKDSANIDYLNKKKKYFFTPTEIFARCFEIYLVNNGVITSFLKEEKELTIEGGYVKVDKNFKKLIDTYFNKIIDVNLELLKENETESKVYTDKATDYIEPVISLSGQLTFGI